MVGAATVVGVANTGVDVGAADVTGVGVACACVVGSDCRDSLTAAWGGVDSTSTEESGEEVECLSSIVFMNTHTLCAAANII